MKVLLLTPPNLANERTLGFISVGLPLGIAYLGAVLERLGHEVNLLDGLMSGFVAGMKPEALTAEDRQTLVRISRGVARKSPAGDEFPPGTFYVGRPFAEIAAEAARFAPDILGISVNFSSQFKGALALARYLKEALPAIPIVFGGSHVTVSPRSVLLEAAVDYIVQGEAEHSLPRLLQAIEAGRPPDDIAGVGYKKADGSLVTRPAELFYDLDELPLPAYHLLPMEDYFAAAAEGRLVKMYTSRGCTFTCTFCSVPFTSQRRFRTHSPERVVAELAEWVKRYRIEAVMFEDDNMSLNPRRFHRIFELIAQRNFGLKLYARNFRCDIMRLETMKLMRQCGFETVWITPESGNERVLREVIDKRMDLGDIEDAVGRIHAAGLKSAAAFVIGMPGEKWAEIQDTVAFARKLKGWGVSEFWISIATPIEGSRMYDTCIRQGLIDGMDLNNFSYLDGTFDTDEFTAASLNRLRDDLMQELNARPAH